jgi:hypothetical protein
MGLRFLVFFSPLARLFVALIPLVAGLTSGLIGFSGAVLTTAANLVIMLAQMAANVAVMVAYGAIRAATALGEMILNTAMSLTSTTAAAQTGIIGLLTTAYALMTGGLMAATTVTGLFAGMITIVMGVMVAIVAILGAVALGVGLVAGAMILAVGFTQGWGAALSALVSFLGGLWTGLQYGISFIMLFVAAIQSMVEWISNVTGVGNEFAVMGFIVGAALSGIIIAVGVLTVALAGLAISMAVTWLAAIAPMAAVVAGIAIIIAALVALGLALTGNTQYLEMFYNGFTTMFDRLGHDAEVAANRMELAFATAIENIINNGNGIIPGLPDALEIDGWSSNVQRQMTERTAKDQQTFSQWVENPAAYENIVSYEDAFGQIWTTDLATGQTISGYGTEGGQATPAARAAVAGQEHGFIFEEPSFTPTMRDEGMARIEENTSRRQQFSIQEWLTQENILSRLNPLLETLGINTENLSFDDLNRQFSELIKIPDSASAMADFDWSILGPNGGEYGKALNAWEEYQEHIQRAVDGGRTLAEATAHVNQLYQEQGLAIPTAPILSDYLASEADAIGQSAEEIEQHLADITAAFEGLKGMSAEDYLGAVFDPLAGQGGKSVASWFAGEGAQTILSSLGENAPWMDQMELMADVAGTGLDLGANVYGQNVHALLTPYLSILSEQTGVEISTMLADIPKFIAPEEFMGIAAGDLMMGISTLGTEMFKTIDTLGMDILDAAGVPMEEFGLEWAELQAYAVGQAVAGTDWNLATYLSESWGISVAEAEAYLASHGIDPNVISDTMFEATEAAALTGNGAYAAMTEEMYNFLAAETANFTDMVIEMTQEEWEAIPPAYRAVMANMGITTIISDGLLPDAALDEARGKIEAFGTLIQSLGTYQGRTGANFVMEGAVESFKEIGMTADGTKYILEDLDGTQVHIPAANYEGYLHSLQLVENATTQFIADYKQLLTPIQEGDTVGNLYLESLGIGTGTGVGADGAPAPMDIGAALGLPSPTQASAYAAEVKSAVTAELATIQTEIGAMEEIEIPISLDFTTFNGDLIWIQTSLSMMGDAVQIPINLDFTTFYGDLMWIQTSLSMMGSAVQIPINLDFTTFNGDLMWIQTSLAMIGTTDITIDLTFNNIDDWNALSESLANFALGSYVLTIDIQFTGITEFNAIATSINNIGLGSYTLAIDISLTGVENFNNVATFVNNISIATYTLTIDISFTGVEDFNTSITNLEAIVAKTWTMTIAADIAPVLFGISTINNQLTTLTTASWIATVKANISSAASDIEQIMQKLRALTAGSWNATVAVNNYASGPLDSILGKLRTIDGFTATSTVRMNTVQTTTLRTVDMGKVSAFASGGWAQRGEVALVGEEGPELVYFPTTGYVYNAPSTADMAASVSENPLSSGTRVRHDRLSESPSVVATGDTNLHFHGDIVINDKAAAREFFNELDRRTGKKTEMARRGMIAIDDTRTW